MSKYKDIHELSHYEILNVDDIASQEHIETAYNKLKFQLHPDSRRVCESHLSWLEGNLDIYPRLLQAYEVLSNPKTRADYDIQQMQQARTTKFSNSATREVEVFSCVSCSHMNRLSDQIEDEELWDGLFSCERCGYEYDFNEEELE